jgi:hypothetical protein
MMRNNIVGARCAVETIGVPKMPVKKRKEQGKIIELPNLAERRRRRLNAEIAENAISAESNDAPNNDGDERQTLKERLLPILGKCAPAASTLSEGELISEITRRFARSATKKRLLQALLQKAADVSGPQRAAAAVAREGIKRITRIIFDAQHKEYSAFLRGTYGEIAAAERSHRGDMIRDAIVAGLQASRFRRAQQLGRIPDEALIKEISRFACPSNDLAPLFEMIHEGIGTSPIRLRRRKALADTCG